MRVCVFEDAGVRSLDPLSLTRPAFDLWCGSTTLLQRQVRFFGAADVGALVRASLAELCQLAHPGLAVNDAAWVRGAAALVNARWLPPTEEPPPEPDVPQVGLVGGQVAFVVLPPPGPPPLAEDTLGEWLERWRQALPHRDAGGAMIDYPWDLVERNGEALCQDLRWRRREWASPAPGTPTVIGPLDRLAVSPGAVVEPWVIADTTRGPVLIDAGAVVHAFSRLEGPCYVGKGSRVLGAKVRGGTIGPDCRVGGEVEASIFQGHSNKYHEGFLGHSYVGEWVNLGAGSQVSDLRNDYGPVSVIVAGQKVSTGLTKVGAFLGDHTKVGLGALLNSGTAAGAFCHLLPEGRLLPKVIPSFCEVWQGQLRGRVDLRELLGTAETVVRRRGQEWGPAQAEFVVSFYERTAQQRRQFLIESEQRRLRRIG
jgi:UDP-N-acetylglucosamine diphosphorylase/glucosamine-1-phosphate N-acetyltransferase